jgi:P27 family predicted phage terminase small subunit
MRKLKPLKKPKPPSHLESETKKWWSSIQAEFLLESHHVKLLTAACESWDRYQQARRVIHEQGLTVADRYGVPKCRPEVAVERDSRIAFSRLLRELNLDSAPEEIRLLPRISGVS